MVQIIIDSASDMPRSIQKAYGIKLVSQQITVKDKTYKDRVDLTPPMFYSLLEKEAVESNTAQPAMCDWYEAISSCRGNKKEVLIITMPACLSGTYASAVLAAKDYKDIRVEVRSTRTLSLGSSLIAIQLARRADQGANLDELLELFDDLNRRVRTFVVIGDMEMLKRGGRISATTAMLGKALNIKPILEFAEEGQVVPVAKVRGWKKARHYLSKRYEEEAGYQGLVGLAHASRPEQEELLMKELISLDPVAEIQTTEIGAVLGAHAGPGTLGLAFFAKSDG